MPELDAPLKTTKHVEKLSAILATTTTPEDCFHYFMQFLAPYGFHMGGYECWGTDSRKYIHHNYPPAYFKAYSAQQHLERDVSLILDPKENQKAIPWSIEDDLISIGSLKSEQNEFHEHTINHGLVMGQTILLFDEVSSFSGRLGLCYNLANFLHMPRLKNASLEKQSKHFYRNWNTYKDDILHYSRLFNQRMSALIFAKKGNYVKVDHNIYLSNEYGISEDIQQEISQIETGEKTAADLDEAIKDVVLKLASLISNEDESEKTPKLDIEDIRPHITEFWKTRDKSKKENPLEFTKRVYKDFIGQGLTQSHLKIDKELYRDIRVWIAKKEEGLRPEWLPIDVTRKPKEDRKPTQEEFKAHRFVSSYLTRAWRNNKKAL